MQAEKEKLVVRYGNEIMKMLSLMSAHGDAKNLELSLADYLLMLETIVLQTIAVHCPEDPETYTMAVKNFSKWLNRESGKLPPEAGKMRERWEKEGVQLYQRMVSERHMRKFVAAVLEAGDDEPGTMH